MFDILFENLLLILLYFNESCLMQTLVDVISHLMWSHFIIPCTKSCYSFMNGMPQNDHIKLFSVYERNNVNRVT